MRRTLLAAALMTFAGSPTVAQAPADSARVAAWREDLDSLATLPRRHPDFFAHAGRERFEREVAALRESIPRLSNRQVLAGMIRVTALGGDAHTSLLPPDSIPFRLLPLQFYWFDDGIRLTGAAPAYAELIGARVVRVGGMDPDSALTRLGVFQAADNEMNRRTVHVNALALPDLLPLAGLGDTAVTFRLETRGAAREITVPFRLAGDTAFRTGPPPPVMPLYRSRPRAYYWSEYLPESRTMYVQYNRCRPDPTLPMERFAAQVFAAADSLGAERLVIDMRLNGGGDSRVLQPFVNRLWRHRLNAPGRLFVAIGRQTFSSGMMNAAQLDRSTHATLVGEPTGGRPNHFGEVRSFRLPNSGATVYHSTRRFEMLPGRDAPSLEPEVRVPVTWADYAAGRDPVLDVILAMPLPESR